MISLVFAEKQFKGIEPYEKWWVALIIGVLFMIMAVSLTLWMRAQGFGKMPSTTSTSADEENGLLEMEQAGKDTPSVV